jgi:EmrB/QacA subfamily drug resistance transporter
MINPRARPCAEGTIRSTRMVASFAASGKAAPGQVVSAKTVSAKTVSAKTWALVAAILGSSIAFVDESAVNVALPAIETDLAASVAVVQWVINAYTLCLASLLLVGGAAGDRFGRRGVFVAGIAVFAAASLWCGLAASVAQLIVARAVQGVGAAMLIPCSLALIGASFDEHERGKAIGTWAAVAALAGAVAPILGGALVDHASWRVIFFINPLLALPTVTIALRHLRETRDPEAPGRLDWRGTLLVFAGLGALVSGLISIPGLGWRNPVVIGLLVLGAALLVGFVREEAKNPAPLVPLALFRSRTFTGVNILTLLLYGALGGAFFFLPFALIQVHGYSATLAGTVFLPFTIILAALSRWSGGLLDRFGARLPLVVGPIIVAIGFALLALPGAGGTYWTTFFVPMVVLGFGMAISVAPLTTTVINAVDEHHAGVASGINNAVSTVASLLAVAIFGIVALGVTERALDRSVAATPVSADVRAAVERAKGGFVIAPALAGLHDPDEQAAEQMIKQSMAEGIRTAMLLAAALSLAGAVCSAVSIRPKARS